MGALNLMGDRFQKAAGREWLVAGIFLWSKFSEITPMGSLALPNFLF